MLSAKARMMIPVGSTWVFITDSNAIFFMKDAVETMVDVMQHDIITILSSQPDNCGHVAVMLSRKEMSLIGTMNTIWFAVGKRVKRIA